MGDNTPASTGDPIATDDLATLNGAPVTTQTKVQRVKSGFGADGDLTDVSDSEPLPVKDLSNNELLRLILVELRINNLHLQQLTRGTDNLERMRSELLDQLL